KETRRLKTLITKPTTIDMIVRVLIPWEIPWLCKIRSVTMIKARIAMNPRLTVIPRVHGNRLCFGAFSTGDLCDWGTISLTFLLKGIYKPFVKVYHEIANAYRHERGATGLLGCIRIKLRILSDI